DNGHILEAIDSQDVRMLGILPVLEEQSSLQTGSSETFTESCHRRFKTSPAGCYVEPRIASKEHFEIFHSCGKVSYCTSKFREKNMNAVLPEIQQLLLGSSSEIVRRICGLSQGLGEDAQALEQRGSAQPKRAYIAGQLLRSVNSLFAMLRASKPRFVKCVKSNMTKQALVMDKASSTRRAEFNKRNSVET
ncbi:unnamed protein product, partial [Polarella glacialis]